MQKLILLFSLIFLVAAADSNVTVHSIDANEIRVAGIGFSDDVNRVKELLGDPLESGPICDGCIDIMDSWFVYDGLRVHFLGAEVFQFEVSTDEYRLKNDIGVGTMRSDVVRQYGNPEITSHCDGVVLAYPIVRNGRAHSDLMLKFLVRDDIVISYQAGPTRTGSSF